MSIIRDIARYMFPSDKQLLRWYRHAVPAPEPRWLALALYGVAFAMLLVIYAAIVS